MDDALLFVLHRDPENPERTWVTVDEWILTMLLSPEMLNTEAHGSSIRLEDGVVRIKVRNGSADYRITGWSREAQALTCTLVTSFEFLEDVP